LSKLGERAVVCGAGMGGLLAARVLADFYQTVTVVERDKLPTLPTTDAGFRRGGNFTLCGVAVPKSWKRYFPVYVANSLRPARRCATTATSPRCPSGCPATNSTDQANSKTRHRWSFTC
jgi:hypothetical protein